VLWQDNKTHCYQEKVIDPLILKPLEIHYVMTSFEFLSNWDTINVFHAYLMAICNENHLNTLVSVNRCKQKQPYDTLFWVARGEFGEVC